MRFTKKNYSTYYLVVIFGHDIQINRSTYEILQMLGFFMDRSSVNELFINMNIKDAKERNDNQQTLKLFRVGCRDRSDKKKYSIRLDLFSSESKINRNFLL